jgi:uncharacterized protein (DUF1684 family)
VLVLAVSLSGCTPGPPDDNDYVSKLLAARAAKDHDFARGDDPIPTSRPAMFLPLAYFPVDPHYNVPAALKPIDDPTVFEMPTSTGSNRKMRRVGTLEFTLKGQLQRLTVLLEIADPGHLFVAFNDLTSGTETYAAGRFMDIEHSATGVYNIDFNRAYIPYCYYNPT